MSTPLDALDIALLTAMAQHPKAGALEWSRQLNVARATVQSRIARLEQLGVIVGYAPRISLSAAGYTVHAFVRLSIAQGRLDDVRDWLVTVPGVVEAYTTTGGADILCRVCAVSNQALHETLMQIARSDAVSRTESVVALTHLIPPRIEELIAEFPVSGQSKSPAFRTAE